RPGGDGGDAHGRGSADRPRRHRAARRAAVPGVSPGGPSGRATPDADVGRATPDAGVRHPPARLGFVGLGAMGGPMGRRLLQAGHQLSVYDTDPAAVAALGDAGANACDSAEAVADAAELVLVSLPSPEVVAEVARELNGGGAMRVYVDLSTTGPHVAEEVAAQL